MTKPTVLSVGGVVVSTTGGQTGALLNKINAATGITTVGATGASLPTPPSGSGPFELVIPAGYTGSLSIPSGYAYVVYGGTGTLTGGDSTTVVVGNKLSYSGAAGTVVGTGSSGTVTDTAPGALLSFFGQYTVSASGANDTVQLDGGSSLNVTVTGANSVVDSTNNSGAASAAAAASAAVASVTTVDLASGATGTDTFNASAGTSNLLFVTTAVDIVQSGGASTVVTGSGGTVTLNATGGSAVIFDHASGGGDVINAGPATEFVAAGSTAAASTYNAASGGADTIFSAGAAVNYSNSLGTAASLFFLGGAGVVTVSAAQAETVFGGTGGGAYSVGATSFEFFGGGGADTITGAVGASSILAFGATNETLTINQVAASTKGNTFVSFGNNDSINATAAAGGNTWQVVNQTLPAAAGGTFTGNSTLVGSSAGKDTFVVYIDASAPAAHTITISNWQTSDVMFISNLASASQALNAADVAAVNAFEGGSSSSLTLADQTTITFVGAKPTTISHL